MRPARSSDHSAVLIVPNVKIRMEAQHSSPSVSLRELLRENFTFFTFFSHRAAPQISKPERPAPDSPESLYLINP